ncbi:MAG: DNA recombination protein RmuC [Deltaproteobacteria bacterium]|nr:DNA recombination protein RmuC [Deltaproteobacteria bacterium]
MLIYIYLLVSLFVIFFAASIMLAVYFASYVKKSKKTIDGLIDASRDEKDSLIKQNITLEEEVKSLNARLEAFTAELNSAAVLTENLREENKNLSVKISEISTENKNLLEKIENIKSDYEDRLKRQKDEFIDFKQAFENLSENLSSKILEEKSKKLIEINKDSISGILKPLSEKILEFQKKVEETYDKESKQRFSLQNEIKKLIDTQDAMKQTTDNLTSALKGSGKVQGDWGEMILEQLLESSELIEGMQYEIQKTVKTINEMDEKINLRPDVIVHLPKDRDLIIDSKVSLTDYEKYMSLAYGSGANSSAAYVNSDSMPDDDPEKFLKSHILSIKRHINELSYKKYTSLYGLKSLDSVIMFIPIEFAYTAAVNYDRDLLAYAYGKKVIIATPSIILLILKIVYNLWIQEKSQENAAEVMVLAGNLYDKFCSFAKSMEDIGTSIEKTSASYNNAKNLLTSGKGNIMYRLEKMRLLGAKTSKMLDTSKFDRDDISSIENE